MSSSETQLGEGIAIATVLNLRDIGGWPVAAGVVTNVSAAAGS